METIKKNTGKGLEVALNKQKDFEISIDRNRRLIPLKLAMAMEEPSELVNAFTHIKFKCGYTPSSYEIDGISTIYQMYGAGWMDVSQLSSQLKMFMDSHLKRRDSNSYDTTH